MVAAATGRPRWRSPPAPGRRRRPGAAARHRVRAQGRLLRDQHRLQPRSAARSRPPRPRRGRSTPSCATSPRSLHGDHHQHRQAPGATRCAIFYVRLADRATSAPHVDDVGRAARATGAVPGITVTTSGLLDRSAAEASVLAPGQRPGASSNAGPAPDGACSAIPGLVDLDTSAKPESRPSRSRAPRRRRPTSAWRRRAHHDAARCSPGRRSATGAPRRRELRRQGRLAPRAARPSPTRCERLPMVAPTPTAAARVGWNRSPRCVESTGAARSTAAT